MISSSNTIKQLYLLLIQSAVAERHVLRSGDPTSGICSVLSMIAADGCYAEICQTFNKHMESLSCWFIVLLYWCTREKFITDGMLNWFCCGSTGLRLVELVEFCGVREISRSNKRYNEHTCYPCL
jgi:hypothetical protein